VLEAVKPNLLRMVGQSCVGIMGPRLGLRQICRELGFVVSSDLDDQGVMLVSKKLGENRL